jgi:hypothetical protein
MNAAAKRVLTSGALIVLGCAAFAATTVGASGQLPPPPTVPSVPSVPTVPAPALPPVPPLPPAPSLPAPTPPAPSLPPAPVAPTAPSTSPLPSPAPTPSAVARVSDGVNSTRAGGPATASAGSGQTPPAGDAASSPSETGDPAYARGTEIRSRSGRRGVAIPFALRRPGRVVVVVRGPLPRCEVVVRLNILAPRGQNRFRFFGQVRGRDLETGTYVIGVRPVRNKRPLWTGVRVDEDGARAIGRAETAAAVAHCLTALQVQTSNLALLSTVKRGEVGPSRPTAPEPTGPPKRPTPLEAPESGGVLPAISELPDMLTPNPGELPPAVGIAALGLLVLSTLGMVVFLVRFLRRGDEF